ncbi:MAG TPA: hypothetical protein PK147_08930 [Saprospiraceae bacterium]|nr:hypothetical protein [Saprospiraceae bacterium]MCB9328359.1 hypothetical protein [Lewinellaceae bacterium]HPK09268.1 hypothetical protein [Saprospiraceae bacterium]HPQ21963.1 hypothetical protein [Saprospiraceae bacterium]
MLHNISHEDSNYITKIDRPQDYKYPCRSSDNYVPYPEDSLIKSRTIRVNVHFIDSTSAKYNIPEPKAETWAYHMIENANFRLRTNEQMNLPEGNETPCIPANYQYRLWKDDSTGLSVHYHYDDELYYMLTKGSGANNYDRKVINKYRIGEDSILNIFILPPHPDSIATGRYVASRSGISLGNSIKLTGPLSQGMKDWEMSTSVNHEAGHSFGLSHSWYKNDGCDDTPPNENCWSTMESGRCAGPTSNNMMDYNNSQMAITPCQLGKINMVMSDSRNTRRKLLVKDWCVKSSDVPITIHEDTSWKGYRDIDRDIIVESGTLSIYCKVSMAQGTKITIMPGATLTLLDAELYNDCGFQWEGIEVVQSKKEIGKFLMTGNAKISDIREKEDIMNK